MQGPTLALDTALSACSAALFSNGDVVAERYAEPGKGHAELLMSQIEGVLADASMTFTDIARVGVTVGPGSFSGVRIALSVARGMALVTGIPVIGITTLEALAAGVPANDDATITAAIDARRGEIYVQSFALDMTPLDQAAAMSPDAAADALGPGRIIAAGSGAPLLQAACQDRDITIHDTTVWPHARNVAILAAGRPVPAGPPDPLYLRAPDAKLPGGK